MCSVKLTPAWKGDAVWNTVPPVVLRSTWYGAAIVKAGQLVAAFVMTVLFPVAYVPPLADAAEMVGLLVVINAPQILMKA